MIHSADLAASHPDLWVRHGAPSLSRSLYVALKIRALPWAMLGGTAEAFADTSSSMPKSKLRTSRTTIGSFGTASSSTSGAKEFSQAELDRIRSFRHIVFHFDRR